MSGMDGPAAASAVLSRMVAPTIRPKLVHEMLLESSAKFETTIAQNANGRSFAAQSLCVFTSSTCLNRLSKRTSAICYARTSGFPLEQAMSASACS